MLIIIGLIPAFIAFFIVKQLRVNINIFAKQRSKNNDEQHFLFTEVDTGRDYYIKEGAEIIHEEYNIMKNTKFKGEENE